MVDRTPPEWSQLNEGIDQIKTEAAESVDDWICSSDAAWEFACRFWVLRRKQSAVADPVEPAVNKSK